MPTLFEQIDAGLSGNDLGERLASQVNKLTAIVGTANNLFQNPPAAIKQLIQSLGSLPLPDTNKLGALPQTITKLQSLMPADLNGVTEKLTSGLTDLAAQADGAIVSKINALINSLKALYGCLQIITGLASANGGTGGDGEVGPLLTPVAALKKQALTGEAGNSPAAATQPTAAPQALAATTTGEINGIIQALDRLPDPLNVESFLEGLNFLLNGFNRSLFPMAHLPFTDELAQTLATLWQWRGMTGGQIAGHLETTLQTTATFIGGRLDGEIQPIATLANTLNSQLDAATLQNVCQNLHQDLQTLAQAVVDADLLLINTTVAGLNPLRSQFNTILSGLMTNFFSGQAPELLERLNSFHDRAGACLCNLLTSLNPATDIALLATLSARINAAYNPDEIDRSLAGYSELFSGLRGLLNQIDLSSLEEPVSTAAIALQGAVADLDNLLVEVVTKVSLLFDDVEAVIDQVDTAGIAAAIQAAVENFQQQVKDQIDNLFSPIKTAITTGINTINAAVGDFDPQDIIEALRQAIQTLTGVLANPQVLGAIKGVREQLDGMTAQLGTISFKPANDVIIGQMDEVKGILQAMDTSLLNNALKLALMAAVELLPGEDDLQGVKNGLLAELDDLTTSGPATLLVAIQIQPEQLLVKVRAFSPLVLVGDALAAPFQQALKQLQGFHPSDLFKPVQAGLDQVKQTLEQKANPGQFIAPLEGPFDELLSLFDQLQPQQLVAPLNQALEQVLSAIIEALPVDELFEILDAVLSRLQMVVDTVGALRALFHRGQALLAGFDDPETQLTTWIDSIIDRLDQVPDTTNLTLAFSQVAEAIADLQAAPILDRLLGPLQPLRQSLGGLAPQACLNGLIRDCRDFPQDAVAGLPQPERQTIENFFATFDPRQSDISRPLNNLQDLADRLQSYPQTITAAFAGWDADYHGPASYLGNLVPGDTSLPAVKSLLRATILAELGQPLAVVLSLLPNLSQMVERFLQIFDEFAADIEAKMSLLVGGPASLTTIRQSMGQLVDTIQGLNFNFLATELEEVFTNVKGKFNAMSPAVLRGVVEDAFAAALANLDLAQLLPTAEVKALDTKFAALLTDLGQLDPHKLVVEVLQPEFESTIKPLLAPFDLTGVITAVIGEMDRLKADLSTELDRTIAAYLAMLDAVPSLELSLDVDLGVDIGF